MEIILTFTYKTSLKVWEETGLLTREMLFYKKLADRRRLKSGRNFANVKVAFLHALLCLQAEKAHKNNNHHTN